MSRRVLALRTRDRATLWLWDWISLPVASLTIYPLVSGLLDGTTIALAWILVGAIAGLTFMTHRIRITRNEPSTGHVTTFLFRVPVRRRQFDLQQLVSAHSDEWTAKRDAPHDEMTSGSWSISCRRAADVAAWLRAAGAELATPRADVRS